MARSTNEPSTDVSETSETSGQANPMSEAPAEPTASQEAEGAAPVTPSTVAAGSPKPSQEALDQAKADEKARLDNPNKAVIREANPAFGGERFDYGQQAQ